jgi:hypothetical protein
LSIGHATFVDLARKPRMVGRPQGGVRIAEPVFEEVSKMSDGPVEKNPEDWATGDEPMTGPQESYLRTLAREAGEDVPDNLTKAEASERIDDLQAKSKRLRRQ